MAISSGPASCWSGRSWSYFWGSMPNGAHWNRSPRPCRHRSRPAKWLFEELSQTVLDVSQQIRLLKHMIRFQDDFSLRWTERKFQFGFTLDLRAKRTCWRFGRSAHHQERITKLQHACILVA